MSARAHQYRNQALEAGMIEMELVNRKMIGSRGGGQIGKSGPGGPEAGKCDSE